MTIRKLQALKAKKGFTLIELIVVIAIIAVLAAILIPILMNYVTGSRVSSANSDAKNIHTVLSTAISTLETQHITLPAAARMTLTKTATTWNAPTVAAPAGAPTLSNEARDGIQRQLNADSPNLRAGVATAIIQQGAAVGVVWIPQGSQAAAGLAGLTWQNTHWTGTAQTRTNMFGTFPDLRAS